MKSVVALSSVLVALATLVPVSAPAQEEAKRGSDNITVLSYIPLSDAALMSDSLTVSDIDMEQELSRPYVYMSRMYDEAGFDIIDIGDPRNAKVIYSWRFENLALHRGTGAMDPKHFKLNARYYLVQSVQFAAGGADHDLGAVVFDVTGLPDVSKVKEVGRIREPETPRGFHNIFIYKHSDGRVLLLTTVSGPFANVYDMGKFVENPEENPRVARIPIPDSPELQLRQIERGAIRGYHDMYAAYHPESGQDRFYGGGAGGYYVYDISNLNEPSLLTSVTGVPGVSWGHTFIPTPDGRYAVGETEYQWAPLRIYDLQPGLEGKVPTIDHAISAWTANWENLVHNHEIRWPYVFVGGYEDGFQVFRMDDPTQPHTVAHYSTFEGEHKTGMCRDRVCNGAWGVDVRNEDGVIVVSDMSSGFWLFHMDGFDGWNGEDWGMPNVSSVQKWDEGPEITS